MATYTFFNVPAWGHVNPTLAVVEELVRRGHNVNYYLTENFRATIQATGATFQPYQSKLQTLMASGTGGFNSANGFPAGGVGPTVLMEDIHSVPPQIIERIRAQPPDAIIYDFMCAWARPVIETLQIPAIAVRGTYASNEQFNLLDRMKAGLKNMPGAQTFMQRIQAMRTYSKERDEAPIDHMAILFSMFSSIEQLNIVFIPRFFQPMEETFDERFLFVGPPILPRYQETPFPLDQLRDDLPLLYISLGSIATNQPEFYKHCFEAFGEQAWQVVLAVGKHIDIAQLGPVPTNFLVSSYVPQLDILPRTQVFVTHAGTNSVMESMYYGVPMVLIPQQPEQYMHAQRTVELGLGVHLDKASVTATTLRAAVDQVAQNTAYRERAQSLQQITRDAGGYQKAADAIIQFAPSTTNASVPRVTTPTPHADTHS